MTCPACNDTGAIEVQTLGGDFRTTVDCGTCKLRCLNCDSPLIRDGHCRECDWPVGKVPSDEPLCSICRSRHPSDDRHPCE